MLDLSVTELFLDRTAVLLAVGRARQRAMMRIGGFIRTTARRSMRKRKGPSAVGSPPNAHVGLLRKHVYFSYDRQSDSVVVGPAYLEYDAQKAVLGGKTIPALLEYGGQFAKFQGEGLEPEIVTMPARPYMGPALGAAARANKLSQAWKDVVR